MVENLGGFSVTLSSLPMFGLHKHTASHLVYSAVKAAGTSSWLDLAVHLHVMQVRRHRKTPNVCPFHNKWPPLSFLTLGKYRKDISLHIVDVGSAHPPDLHDYLRIRSGWSLGILRQANFTCSCKQQRCTPSVQGIIFNGNWILIRRCKLLAECQHRQAFLQFGGHHPRE